MKRSVKLQLDTGVWTFSDGLILAWPQAQSGGHVDKH
jgi:hypothetical protein